jgi:hypothetical protein
VDIADVLGALRVARGSLRGVANDRSVSLHGDRRGEPVDIADVLGALRPSPFRVTSTGTARGTDP